MIGIASNLFVIKISIVLEININSSSQTDRGEGTSNFKILLELYE